METIPLWLQWLAALFVGTMALAFMALMVAVAILVWRLVWEELRS